MLRCITTHTKIQGMKRREQLSPYLRETTSNQALRTKAETAQCLVCLPQTDAWAELESLRQIGHQVLCLCYQTQSVDAINKEEKEKREACEGHGLNFSEETMTHFLLIYLLERRERREPKYWIKT